MQLTPKREGVCLDKAAAYGCAPWVPCRGSQMRGWGWGEIQPALCPLTLYWGSGLGLPAGRNLFLQQKALWLVKPALRLQLAKRVTFSLFTQGHDIAEGGCSVRCVLKRGNKLLDEHHPKALKLNRLLHKQNTSVKRIPLGATSGF